jgi:hypothetical protein
MTFEEYKQFWIETNNSMDSDETIYSWYDEGSLAYWTSVLKTRELQAITAGIPAKEFTVEELRENGRNYRAILRYKQEQDKLKKIKEDF